MVSIQIDSPTVSSPKRFTGKVPRIFGIALLPAIVLFSIYQCILGALYVQLPAAEIVNIAIQNAIKTNINSSGQDDEFGKFGKIIDELKEGMLRNKDDGNEASKRQDGVKSMLEIIMNEINDEVRMLEEQETSKLGRNALRKKSEEEWQWGPKVKEPAEFPKSMTWSDGAIKSLIMEKLEWDYNVLEKKIPFVENPHYADTVPKPTANFVSPKYTNNVVVAPFADASRKHGLTGVDPSTGKLWWKQKETPVVCDTVSEDECKKRLSAGGGFDLTLSDGLPLDTQPLINHLPDICMEHVKSIDISELPDASVVITFYNEPISTLLRTVVSVLNNTPPPILREITLVDDHSDREECLAGGPLDEAVKYLPKVKILRQPVRRGLVMGRIAGIQNSLGAVSVVLDSHVEVNEYWLEPLLQRVVEEPKAVVFPIIASIDPQTFLPKVTSGIGTWLSWNWNMQEQATFTFPPTSIAPVPSASMAGGLFAVRRDTFFELGAYDEKFSMWGAENVEMPFRIWMCGGRVEGIPCSLTYHIYRKGGIGYKSPDKSIVMNRLRTARIWMDEWYMIAKFFILFGKSDKEKEDRIVGNMDEMLVFKDNMKCNNFDWFLKNIDPNHTASNLSDIKILGTIRSMKDPSQCVDNHGKSKDNDVIGTYSCHGEGVSQAFYSGALMDGDTAKTQQITCGSNVKMCLARIHPIDKDSKPLENFGMCGLNNCSELSWNLTKVDIETAFPDTLTLPSSPDNLPKTSKIGRIIQNDKNHPEYGNKCLTKFDDRTNVAGNLSFIDCDLANIGQWWWLENVDITEGYEAPKIRTAHLDFIKHLN